MYSTLMMNLAPGHAFNSLRIDKINWRLRYPALGAMAGPPHPDGADPVDPRREFIRDNNSSGS
jgi:hypothetical protein